MKDSNIEAASSVFLVAFPMQLVEFATHASSNTLAHHLELAHVFAIALNLFLLGVDATSVQSSAKADGSYTKQGTNAKGLSQSKIEGVV